MLGEAPFDVLNTLLESCTPRIVTTEEGKLEQRLHSPSLLGMYAAMALTDLTETGRAVRACLECGKLFSAVSYQAAYCSPRCKDTHNKRAHRHRVRDARRAKTTKRKGSGTGRSKPKRRAD